MKCGGRGGGATGTGQPDLTYFPEIWNLRRKHMFNQVEGGGGGGEGMTSLITSNKVLSYLIGLGGGGHNLVEDSGNSVSV